MGETTGKDARTWAMLCHLTAFSGFVGVPFGNILCPLVCWLVKREEHPFVDDHGKESLNFQISMTIYGIVAAVLCFFCIGFVLVIALFIAEIVLVINAAVQANDGQPYSYPYTIRFIH